MPAIKARPPAHPRSTLQVLSVEICSSRATSVASLGSPRRVSPAAGREDKAASLKGTPIALAAARAEEARKLPIDRSKYQTIRGLDQLNAFIARVHDAGHVAIEAKAASIDPMQTDICGIALALAPNDVAYVPLAHRQSGDGGGLFDAGLAPDQIKLDDAVTALRADPGIAGYPQDRLQHQVQRGDVRTGRHYHPQSRRRAVDVIRARRRPQRRMDSTRSPNDGWPRHLEPWRVDRQAARTSSVSTRSRSTGRRPIRPKMPM